MLAGAEADAHKAHLAASDDQDALAPDLPGQDERASALDLGMLALHGGVWGGEKEGIIARGWAWWVSKLPPHPSH